MNLKKLLSYLWPLTFYRESKYNGDLEIMWWNGKKLLNSKNANYSYGSLQSILEEGLDTLDLHRVQRVLLLGLGGGSVIQSLREKYLFTGDITAVELDPKIIAIAQRDFLIDNDDATHLIESDAFAFLRQADSTFDLIIVDVFLDTEVPEAFLHDDFTQLLIKKAHQYIVFNFGIHKKGLEKAHEVIAIFQERFGANFTLLKKVEGTNYLGVVDLAKNKQPVK